MAIEINKIKEIYKGHYWVLLDFPTKEILNQMIDMSFKYVWIIDYVENQYVWNDISCNFLGTEAKNVAFRNTHTEVLVETKDFISMIPQIHQGIHLILLNKKPPVYLDVNKIKGASKYDILKKETDYLFEIKLPGSPDYTEVISSSQDYLIQLLKISNSK